MEKLKTIVVILLIVIVVAGSIFLFVGYFKPKGAGIFVDSVPASSVFIDGEKVGTTPFKQTRNPQDVTVKLIPESFDNPLPPYETKVDLVSGIETVIRYEFNPDDEKTAEEILSFEEIGGDSSSFSVVSQPDTAQVTIDDTTRAFTPYKTSALSAGKHKVLISAPDYENRELQIQTVKGYKLIAFVKLAKSQATKPSKEEEIQEPQSQEITFVEILETPTGFLRVRAEPSTQGEEISRVEPGEQYEYLETDDETGWYKIKLDEEGLEGWVTDSYSKIITKNESDETPEEKATSSAQIE